MWAQPTSSLAFRLATHEVFISVQATYRHLYRATDPSYVYCDSHLLHGFVINFRIVRSNLARRPQGQVALGDRTAPLFLFPLRKYAGVSFRVFLDQFACVSRC